MAEYIERAQVKDELLSWAVCIKHPEHLMKEDALRVIDCIPAADVQPVVHGHWSIRCETHHDTHTGEVDEEFYLECSECKRKVWDVSQDAIIMGDYRKAIADFPYCHCGARMDGE